MKLSEKFAMCLIWAVLLVSFSVNVAIAGDKGSFGYEKTINIYDLSTWEGVPSITDPVGDTVDEIQEANITDIKEVWICNNYTHLFIRVDVVGKLPAPNTAPYFAMQLYIEDIAGRADEGTELFMDYGHGVLQNDINASFLFSKWSQGGYCRFNYTGGTWTWDQDLNDPSTQGAVNWTVNGNSFVMMIYLGLLSSTGEVASGDSFKFEIFTIYSPDQTSWYAEDYLDFATYTLTGEVVPEFTGPAIILIILVSTIVFTAARKRKFLS